MGFTIGGIREIRSGARRRGRSSECTAVAEYTGLWGWDVVAGRPRAAAGRLLVRRQRAAPRPARIRWTSPAEVPAGATLDEVTEAWAEFPGAAVLLPVGRAFDVIEVAEPAGRRALVRLERMGLPLGPGRGDPGRPRPVLRRPGRRRRTARSCSTAWAGTTRDLDLRGLGPGAHITAPPSDLGGLGPVRWLRPPALDTAAAARRRRGCCWARWRTSATAPGRDAAPTDAHAKRPSPAASRGRALPVRRTGVGGAVSRRSARPRTPPARTAPGRPRPRRARPA